MPQRNIEGQYPYAYQGQEKDAETGMEAFELRLWDARLGRWLTTDPYGQYASPYLGMGNDPVNGIDPDGGWKTKWGRFWGWVGNGFKGSFTESENPATPWHKYGIRETSSLEGGGVLFNHKFGEGWKNEAINAGYTFNGGFAHFQGVISPTGTLSNIQFWRNSPADDFGGMAARVGVDLTYGTVENIYTMFSGGRTFSGEQLQGQNAFDKSFDGFLTLTTFGYKKIADGTKTLKLIPSTIENWNKYQNVTKGLFKNQGRSATTIKAERYKLLLKTHNESVRVNNLSTEHIQSSEKVFSGIDTFLGPIDGFINGLND